MRPRDQGAGRSDHPPTHARAVHQRCRATPSAPTTPSGAAAAQRVGPKGTAGASSRSAGSGDRRDRGAPRGIAARDPKPSCPTATPAPWACCRARHRGASSTASAPRCSIAPSAPAPAATALAATTAAKVGMHLEHFADAPPILIWGGNSITSNLHFWTFAQAWAGAIVVRASTRAAPDRRQVPPARRTAARHRRRALALGLMHELMTGAGWTRTTSTPHRGWPALPRGHWPGRPKRTGAVWCITRR